MSSQQHVHALMTEVGPHLELLELTEYEDDASWWLVFDEHTVVITDYVAEEDRLVITATVATPDAEQRHHIYEQLLQYNYHWEDTGSVRMALDGPAGDLVQIADLRVTGLELQTLHDALRNFTDKVHAWREALTGTATDGADTTPPSDTPPATGIRV